MKSLKSLLVVTLQCQSHPHPSYKVVAFCFGLKWVKFTRRDFGFLPSNKSGSQDSSNHSSEFHQIQYGDQGWKSNFWSLKTITEPYHLTDHLLLSRSHPIRCFDGVHILSVAIGHVLQQILNVIIYLSLEFYFNGLK